MLFIYDSFSMCRIATLMHGLGLGLEASCFGLLETCVLDGLGKRSCLHQR